MAGHESIPDSKVHGANMVPIWGRQGPGGSHVGPMNFAIWDAWRSSVLWAATSKTHDTPKVIRHPKLNNPGALIYHIYSHLWNFNLEKFMAQDI